MTGRLLVTTGGGGRPREAWLNDGKTISYYRVGGRLTGGVAGRVGLG